MKMIVSVLFLSLVVLPAFAQDTPPADDPYAKFQGVWYWAYSGEKFIFIFIDDYCIEIEGESIEEGNIVFFTYNIEDQYIVPIRVRELGDSGWVNPVYNQDTTDNEVKIQYAFFGENLILLSPGGPMVFSRDYTDFSEW
jgi:hypothetical protein